MKKLFYSVALLAVFGMTTIGCQKERIVENQMVKPEMNVKYLVYTIDGVTYNARYENDVEYSALIRQIVAYTRKGSRVELVNNTNTNSVRATKETVTYTTTSEEDAALWSEKMAKDGYTVTVTFNPDDKVFTCIAVK